MLAEKKISSKINYDVLRGLKSEAVEETLQVVKKEEPVCVKDNSKDKSETNAPVEDNDDVLLLKDMPAIYETGLLKRAKSRLVFNCYIWTCFCFCNFCFSFFFNHFVYFS